MISDLLMGKLFKIGLLVSIVSLGACVEAPDILVTITRPNNETDFTADACAASFLSCSQMGVAPVSPFSGSNLTGTVGIFLDPTPEFDGNETMILEIQRTANGTGCRAFNLIFSEDELPLEIKAEENIDGDVVINDCPKATNCTAGRVCGTPVEDAQ